jgi:CheY-like chemotaxis protein
MLEVARENRAISSSSVRSRQRKPAVSDKPILVVEDESTTRQALKRLLETAGYEVVCAANGREALLYLLSGGRPAIILLDLNMPVLDGRQFRELQRAEADGDVSGIPVILLSSAADLPAQAAALQAADCVAKPVEFAHLLDVIRSCG